jgi:3'(2'), 5'-bisphosphate nucleotidase
MDKSYSKEKLFSLCNQCINIAKDAGKIILQYYNSFDASKDLNYKSDNTPITKADLAAHDVIFAGLNNLNLDCKQFKLPVLSEESSEINTLLRLSWDDYWLVDPLDGTKEFINKSDEFCINIALIKNHRPILGVIYMPCFDLVYFAIDGYGAYKLSAGLDVLSAQKIQVNNDFANNINIISSKRHHKTSKYNDFLRKLTKKNLQYNTIQKGSALKFCLIADGTADLYPRFGFTSEWDTAAGDCIVHEAGGIVRDLNNNLLSYNTRETLINPEFYAAGDKDFKI